MRAFTKTLQHPSFRPAAFWTLGFVSVFLFFRCVLQSAHSNRPTLGVISGLFDGLIWAGREWAAVVESHSSALIVTFLVLAAISLALPNVRRALIVRSFVAGILASLLVLLSMVNMMEENYGLAVGLALVSGLVLLAGTRDVKSVDFTTTYEWPVWIPLGVAVLFRFWSLAEVPRGFAQHAVAHLQLSRKLYDALHEVVRSFNFGPMIDLLPYFRDQHGPLSMIDGLGLFVFGVGMVEARMTQAVLGCIAVVVAYGLGRELEGPRLGFLCSFMFAVSPWHLAFSRYGDGEHVIPTLHVFLAMYWLVRAARYGRRRDYALCGLMVGCSWYVYATNQVVPIVVGFFLIFKLVTTRGYWRWDWTKLVLLAAIVMVVSYPHISSHIDRGDTWIARSPSTELNPDALSEYQTAFQTAIQLYVQVNDPWFFRPGGGLGPAVQSLVIVGFIVCLGGLFVRQRRDASVLLLLWLTLAFLPALLSEPHFRRLLLVPMVAIVLSAMAISRILGLLENGGFTKKTVAALAICLCLLFAVSGAYVYFDRVSILECNHHLDHTQLASFVARNIETSFVYVYAPFDDYREEVEVFVELIASRQIADIRGRGASERDYFQVLTPQGLSDAVDFIRAGDRAVSVVAHDSAEWQAEASGGLASAMEIDNCKVVRMGSLTIWSCSGTGDQQPGSGDQDSAREGE